MKLSMMQRNSMMKLVKMKKHVGESYCTAMQTGVVMISPNRVTRKMLNFKERPRPKEKQARLPPPYATKKSSKTEKEDAIRYVNQNKGKNYEIKKASEMVRNSVDLNKK